MRYFYDAQSDSLSLTLNENRRYGDSVEATPGVVLDFDEQGRLLGLDLEHASEIIDVQDLSLHEEPVLDEAAATRLSGTRLKRERERLGLSQAELGRRLGVATNTVARWERGELKIEHPAMLKLALQALHRAGGSEPAGGKNSRPSRVSNALKVARVSETRSESRKRFRTSGEPSKKPAEKRGLTTRRS